MNFYDSRELDLRISIHEKICAERYDKIFQILEENRKELKELRQIASMGIGAWKFIFGIGVILTIIFTSLRIFNLTTFKE